MTHIIYLRSSRQHYTCLLHVFTVELTEDSGQTHWHSLRGCNRIFVGTGNVPRSSHALNVLGGSRSLLTIMFPRHGKRFVLRMHVFDHIRSKRIYTPYFSKESGNFKLNNLLNTVLFKAPLSSLDCTRKSYIPPCRGKFTLSQSTVIKFGKIVIFPLYYLIHFSR